MRCIDLIASFELEINKLDEALEKPVTDDSIYWINQAIVKFVKDRFNGNAPKRTSYEQNEKRTRDLINLLREVVITENGTYDYGNHRPSINTNTNTAASNDIAVNGDTLSILGLVDQNILSTVATINGDTIIFQLASQLEELESLPEPEESSEETTFDIDTSHANYNSYEYDYPSDMMFVLNEDVVISDLNDNYMTDTSVFECTADNFMYRIKNSLTDFHYKFHNARPLRVRTKNGFRLLTDKKYKINQYTLGYIAIPTLLNNLNPYTEYKDFPEYIWPEIIKIAALMYVENQADPRYKTLTNEVLTQE